MHHSLNWKKGKQDWLYPWYKVRSLVNFGQKTFIGIFFYLNVNSMNQSYHPTLSVWASLNQSTWFMKSDLTPSCRGMNEAYIAENRGKSHSWCKLSWLHLNEEIWQITPTEDLPPGHWLELHRFLVLRTLCASLSALDYLQASRCTANTCF